MMIMNSHIITINEQKLNISSEIENLKLWNPYLFDMLEATTSKAEVKSILDQLKDEVKRSEIPKLRRRALIQWLNRHK